MALTTGQSDARGRANRTPAPDFSLRPLLVFWETTRACHLACRHCRADAIRQALPGELSASVGRGLIRQVAAFGRPSPVLVFTGGDCLMRPDLFDLAECAAELGVPVCMSTSVTPLLTEATMRQMLEVRVKAVSISLDGASAETHDAIRGIPGHFRDTVAALRSLLHLGLRVQVNTAVMRENVDELADLAALLRRLGIPIWEVFFLIQVGRGIRLQELSPAELEQVCHFLHEASCHGLVVRTVEGPFFRRVVGWRTGRLLRPARAVPVGEEGELCERLSGRLRRLLGAPGAAAGSQSLATRDGKGIVFVAHNGDVYPAGFLPLSVGNVRQRPLADIYRDSELLRRIRRGNSNGRCGRCEYRDLCGGSRARAFAATGDPLGEDPGCAYVPSGAGPAES